MRIPYALLLAFMFSCSGIIAMAQTMISGKITDRKSNDPLKGATVRIDGTTMGGLTAKDGSFSIKVGKGGTYKLSVNFVGYKKQSRTVSVKDGETASAVFNLEADLLKLNETVVVGYGTTQKRDVTGSYATVKSEEIVNRPAPSFESLLQGRSPGVQVLQSNGMAGTAATVRVRGVGSISANTQPLYVVDGVPITTGDFGSGSIATNSNALSFLNPNDIESIDILKDAAATAIYGSRGANGVVLITTKRGKLGAARISMGVSQGIKTEAKRLDIVDRDTWINLFYEARRNDVVDSLQKLTVNKGKSWTNVQGMIDTSTTWQNIINNTRMPQGFTRETAANTNWLDQTLRTGNTQEAYLTISGGSETTKYYFNTTYFNEKGFIVGNDYQRINTRITLDQKANDWLDIGVSFNANREENNRVNSAWAGGFGNAFSASLPIFPVYDSTGAYWRPQTGLNPVADLENRRFLATTWRLFGNGYAQVNLTDNLNIRFSGGVDFMSLREDRFAPIVITADPTAEERRVQVVNWTTNAILSWKALDLEDHQLTVVGGMESQRSEQRDLGTTGNTFPNNYFTTPQSASVRNGYAFGTEFGLISYLARTNYTLMDRYLFSLSIRTDGSSRFGENNRYGFFPAGSFAWIMSNEDFLKGNDVLTFAKIRASYGISGNAAIGDFTWQGVYSTGSNYNGNPGTMPGQLPNSDLTWETSRQLDLGIDFGLFNDRISGSIGYYDRMSYGMLLNERVPSSSGFSSVINNVGEMSNTGIEFNIRSVNISTPEFEWTTDFNITYNVNKIISLGTITNPDGVDLGFGETRAIVGYPFASFFIVRSAGVDPETGLPVYYRPTTVAGADGKPIQNNGLNGRSLTLEEARDSLGVPLPWNATWRVPTGKNYPDFFGGITNTFRYENFDFTTQFVYQIGNTIYDDAGKRLVGNMGFSWNQMTKTLERWTEPGQETDVPRLTLKGNRDINTDRFIYNGDFLRLRQLTIGYTLPKSMSEGMGFSTFRIYLTGINLLTFTSFPGWDPEVVRDHNGDQQRNGNQGVTYLTPPQAQTYNVGINVDF